LVPPFAMWDERCCSDTHPHRWQQRSVLAEDQAGRVHRDGWSISRSQPVLAM